MTETHALTEEIWIDATPERVFRALTDADEIPAWWAVPGAYETTDAEIDLRVGGRYRFTGTSEALGSFAVEGEFREIEPPRHLAYTWNPEWDDEASGSLVSISLEAREGGTRLVVEHTGLGSRSARDDHAEGWPPVLASLKSHAEADRQEIRSQQIGGTAPA